MECKVHFFFRIVLLIDSASLLYGAFYEEKCAVPEKPKNANAICEGCDETEDGIEVCSFCSATCYEYYVLEGTTNEKRITLECKNGEWVRLEKGTVGNDGKMPDCVYDVGRLNRPCRLPIQRNFPCQIFCSIRRLGYISYKQSRCWTNCLKKLREIERKQYHWRKLIQKKVSWQSYPWRNKPGNRNSCNKKVALRAFAIEY